MTEETRPAADPLRRPDPAAGRRARLLLFWDYDTQWGADRSRTPGGPKDWGALEFPCTDRLLEIHRRFSVPACFAVVGRAALPGDRPYHDPGQIRRIHREGHEVASHAHEHEWLPALSRRELLATLAASRDALEQCVGERVETFVPPYNEPFDYPARLAFSLSERREVRGERTDLPGLCAALAETGYRFCRVSYRGLPERLRAAAGGWLGAVARPGQPEMIAGVTCVRLNTPGGFDERAVETLERAASRGGLVVAYGHPHSLRSGNAQDERRLVAFLEVFARLRAEGRAEAVLPRELLAEEGASARADEDEARVDRPAAIELRASSRERDGGLALCAVSYKECWQDDAGRWMSSGGFPLQMAGVGSLFDRMRLVVVRGAPRAGGVPLPPQARVVELPAPRGTNAARKLSVLLRSPRYGAILAREIARADVVHTPLPGDIPLLAFLIAAASGKRVIARYGSSWDTNSQTTLANRCTRGLLRVLAGGRRVVLATGGGAGEPAPRAHWIFATALTRAEIEATTPDLDRGLSDPPRLLTIGRLSSEKGVDVLLRAVARLAREGRTVRLTLAGDGPERASLEALARELDIADRVRFAGQLGREGLAREIARADLCVAPSRTEGFSKAWLDAFAGGLPVLATRVGAAEAAVGGPLVREGGDGEGGDGDDDLKGLARERGWLVRPDDAGALADALGAIVGVGGNGRAGRAGLAPVDWPALRRRCREFVASRTLEAWADRIGRICADQWGMAFEGGKLLRPVRPLRAAANGGVRA